MKALKSKSMTVEGLFVTTVVTVKHDASLVDCARIMHDDHVGSLVVVEARGGRNIPVGMLTDRDIAIEAVAFALDTSTITAGDIMAQPIITARSDEDLMAVLARMRKHGIRRIPIISADGSLAGILAADDIWETLAKEVDGLVHVMRAEHKREVRTRAVAHVVP